MSKKEKSKTEKIINKTFDYIKKHLTLRVIFAGYCWAIISFLCGQLLYWEDTQAWYFKYSFLGATVIISGFLFLFFGKDEVRLENLIDIVKTEKRLRNPGDKDVMTQMKRELRTLATDDKITPKDIDKLKDDLDKVKMSMELKKDEFYVEEQKKIVVNQELDKGTSRKLINEKTT